MMAVVRSLKEYAYFKLLSTSIDGQFYTIQTAPAVIFMAYSFLSKWFCSQAGRAKMTFSCSLTVCKKYACGGGYRAVIEVGLGGAGRSGLFLPPSLSSRSDCLGPGLFT